MITAASDADEGGIRRSVVAFIEVCSTPSSRGAIGSEGDAVTIPACDGNEVSIRRSIVALIFAHVTPSDHCALGLESDA